MVKDLLVLLQFCHVANDTDCISHRSKQLGAFK